MAQATAMLLIPKL